MKLVKSVVCVALLVSFVLVGLSTSAVAQGLTDDEAAGLLYMWEEEKLARDVYIKMYALYGKRIFSNIIESEQRHMEAIDTLLERYGLYSLAVDSGDGVFTNPDIQALYNELFARGNRSFEEALCVGVDIENLDIEDLTELIDGAQRRDIRTVYTNLRAASLIHLETFEGQLNLLGVTCADLPQE